MTGTFRGTFNTGAHTEEWPYEVSQLHTSSGERPRTDPLPWPLEGTTLHVTPWSGRLASGTVSEDILVVKPPAALANSQTGVYARIPVGGGSTVGRKQSWPDKDSPTIHLPGHLALPFLGLPALPFSMDVSTPTLASESWLAPCHPERTTLSILFHPFVPSSNRLLHSTYPLLTEFFWELILIYSRLLFLSTQTRHNICASLGFVLRSCR